MSMIKRYIEDKIDEISKKSGYDYCFLMDMLFEMIEDGETMREALEYVEGVAMEHDF